MLYTSLFVYLVTQKIHIIKARIIHNNRLFMINPSIPVNSPLDSAILAVVLMNGARATANIIMNTMTINTTEKILI
jgi:hypothetical protein